MLNDATCITDFIFAIVYQIKQQFEKELNFKRREFGGVDSHDAMSSFATGTR